MQTTTDLSLPVLRKRENRNMGRFIATLAARSELDFLDIGNVSHRFDT